MPSSISSTNLPSPQPTPPFDENDRLTTVERTAYAAGFLPHQICNHAISYFITPIYSVILGVSPVFVGNIQLLAQAVAFLFEPFWANLSDNSRSRWGRRRPFLLIGGSGCILFFLAFCFFPVHLTVRQYAYYLGGSVLGFSLFQSLYGIGYVSLLPEITTNEKERTRTLALAIQLFTAAALGTVWGLPLTQSQFFSSIRHGMWFFGTYMGCVSALAVMGMLICVKERYAAIVARVRPSALKASLNDLAHLAPIYPLLFMKISISVAGQLVNSLGAFIGLYFVFDGDLRQASLWGGIAGTAYLAAVFFVVNPAVQLCNQIGRKRGFLIFAGIMILASLIKPICYIHGFTWQILLPSLLMGPACQVLAILMAAQTADLADYAELKTGRRQEAIIGMALGWVERGVYALGLSVAGYLLIGTGFRLDLGSAQLPGVFERLMFWFVTIPIGFTLCGVIALYLFPLTESRMIVIRSKLRILRGAVPS